MKEQIKAPEKKTTERQRDSQPIRCTVQNTGNQYAHKNGHKIEEKVKAMQSEIKENVQESTVMGRKPGLKSKIWNRRKK